MPVGPWLAGALVAVASVVGFAPDVVAAQRATDHAQVAGASEIKVGAELMAIQDVTLDEAVVARGSRVAVTAKSIEGGNVYLDVALADGHVVKGVPLTQIQRSFRLVA
jgi:hypothetical protein